MAGQEVAVGYITLMPKVSGSFGTSVSKSMATVGSGAGHTFGASFNKGFSAATVAVGNLISGVVSKAMGAVSSSIGSAISRVDTLNQFPKVMKNVGYTTEQADAALQKLSDGIQGLPTTLDGIVRNAQMLGMTLGDLDYGSDVVLGLNDGMLTFGASAAYVDNAIFQLNQMVSANSYDMQSWRSVMEAAPGYLDVVAQSIMGAGANANTLHEALKEGQVSTQEFLDAIVRLDKEGMEGMTAFAESAKTATGGIATSFANMRTAVVRNVANLINEINGPDNRLAQFADKMKLVINDIGKAFMPLATTVGEVFQYLLDNFDRVWASFQELGKRFAWAIEPVTTVVGDVFLYVGAHAEEIAGAFLRILDSATKFVRPIAESLVPIIRNAVLALGPVVMGILNAVDQAFQFLADHADQLAPVIMAVVAGFTAFKGASGVVGFIVDVVGKFKALGGVLGAAKTAVGLLGGAFTALGSPVAIVIGVIAAVVAAIVYLWNTSDDFRYGVETGLQALAEFFGNVWQTITDIVTLFITAIANVIFLGLQGIIDFFGEFVDGAVQVWEGFTQTVGDIVNLFGTGITSVFTLTFQAIGKTLDDANRVFTSVFSGIFNFVVNTWNSMWNAVTSAINSAKQTLTNVLNAIKTAFQNAWNGITNAVNTAKGIIKGAIDTIAGIFRGANFQLPKIKLPHISISGGFSLSPLSVPHFGISWYKTGGIATDPTLVGIGEAGNEAIVPLQGSYMKPFADAIAEQIGEHEGGDTSALLREAVELLRNGMTLVADTDAMGRALARPIDIQLRRAAW